MKTLLVYYSLNGNTKLVAEKTAEALSADILPLTPKKHYPDSGFKKFLVGGGDVVAKRRPKLEEYAAELSDYERIIFASPVWASSPTPPLMSFIDENADALSGKRFACIFCHAGGGAEKAVSRLAKKLGIDSFDAELDLIDPKSHPGEETDDRIREFCDKLV